MTDPRATYRVQLQPAGPGGPALDFAAVRELVDYLADLGISHVYLSPLLRARPGSTHGYDVADPTEVAPALGGEDALRALAQHAHARGLALLVDIVPNHLGTGPDTPLWEDLLREGHAGPAGETFDVDWHPALPGADGKVIVPVLGDQYGHVLHSGALELADDGEGVRLRYYDHSFPLSPETSAAVERTGDIDAFAGTVGQPETWQRLHALVEAQHYRLVHWRAGDGVINYRRFFAITELAAVRVEDASVYASTHACILRLVREGVIDALRIDHPDGLREPGRYLERLADDTGGVWTLVEKILEPGETLPDWPVAGTTGYEFCNDVLGLYVDPAAADLLTALDAEFGAPPQPYAERLAAAKRQIMSADLAADVARLASRLWHVAQLHLEARDVDGAVALRVLSDALAALHVYRTYVDPRTGTPRDEDIAHVRVLTQAGGAGGPLHRVLANLLEQLLSGGATAPEELDVVARFQQLSGAVMAKGVEDTLFYRYRRLLALNEVGGDPERFGLSVDAFHKRNEEQARDHPAGMLTTATHDTKRGEDVRLRMAAISELAPRWAQEVRAWRAENAAYVRRTPGGPAPDAQTEYLLYQTLVGVWPLQPSADVRAEIAERVVDYGVKASREAKERTSWTDVGEAFEQGVREFVHQALDPSRSQRFIARCAAFARDAAEIAMVSGLAQVLLRSTCPGVPDTYQGNELWDDSLVDPDNRRPIDFALRRALLAELDAEFDAGAAAGRLWAARRDGRVKLWVLSRALRTRRDHTPAFAPGSGYRSLGATGRFAEHLVGFARTAPEHAVLVVAPRLPGTVMGEGLQAPLGERWGDTALSVPDELAGDWVDVLAGGTQQLKREVRAGDLLRVLPVALLTRA